jgi:hypothetical protein
MVFPTLAPMNKSTNFGLKEKKTIFFYFFRKKKKGDMHRISDSHFTIKLYKSNIQQS